MPSAARLARLAAERGPIRRHLEGALSSPVAGATAETLGVSLEEAREELVGTPNSSSGWKSFDTIAKGQVATQPRAGSTNYRHVLLLVVVFLAGAYIAFLSEFKNI